MSPLRFLLIGCLSALSALAGPAGTADNWPQWRGPLANGVAPRANPPIHWSETNNLRWKLPLPGKGHSSPIVFGDSVYLLSAVPGQRGDSLHGALLGRRYWEPDERAAIERAEAILERFGLSTHANTYAGDLSGGQRRLVEIMRALMTEPRVLLLDEPMAGVHPELANRIGGLLLELCAEGITIVMVEHELAIMDEFADTVVAMAEGRVLAQGTMSDLRAQEDVVAAYLVG